MTVGRDARFRGPRFIGNAGLSVGAGACPPAAHAASHENGGSDEISVAGLSGELADPQPPKTHATSHQNGGSDEISVAGLSGLLADNQNPVAHNTSHQSGGGDAIKLDDLAAPDDNTDLNSTVSAHGLLPKLGGGTTNFLRADGAWAAPGGGGTPNVGFYAYRASRNQTLNSASETQVEFPNDQDDPGNDFNTTTDEFVAPTTGRYTFSASAQITLAAAGRVELRLYHGSTCVAEGGSRTNQAETIRCSVSVVRQMSSSTTMEVRAFQTSGFAATIQNANLHFSGAQLRAD